MIEDVTEHSSSGLAPCFWGQGGGAGTCWVADVVLARCRSMGGVGGLVLGGGASGSPCAVR